MVARNVDLDALEVPHQHLARDLPPPFDVDQVEHVPQLAVQLLLELLLFDHPDRAQELRNVDLLRDLRVGVTELAERELRLVWVEKPVAV